MVGGGWLPVRPTFRTETQNERVPRVMATHLFLDSACPRQNSKVFLLTLCSSSYLTFYGAMPCIICMATGRRMCAAHVNELSAPCGICGSPSFRQDYQGQWRADMSQPPMMQKRQRQQLPWAYSNGFAAQFAWLRPDALLSDIARPAAFDTHLIEAVVVKGERGKN